MTAIKTIDIGQRIKLARNKRGMTQESLAKLLNVSKQLVCSWEQGRSEILTTDMAKTSLVLGFDFRWLVFGGNLDQPGMPLVQTPTAPLLTMSQVVAFSLGELDLAAIPKRVAVSRAYSARTFCVRIRDDGMSPSLLRHDIVVVDPELPVEPCSTVAAVLYSASGDNSVVREVRFNKAADVNAPFVLSASKQGYPAIRVKKKSDGQLVGCIVELIRQLTPPDAGTT
jgi:transcriptional regulator with XRE-family HTH domain